LDQPSFHSLAEMEHYAAASYGSVYVLLLEAAGIKSETAKEAACSLGKAQVSPRFLL